MSTIFVFCVNFGRKGKKADEATKDPRDIKKARLRSKSVKGFGGQAVKQANYRRRQVLEGYIETLRHVRGEAYTDAENSQALLSYFILCLKYKEEHKSPPTRNHIVAQVTALLGRGGRSLVDAGAVP